MMMTGKIGQLTLAPFARIGAAKVLFIVPFFSFSYSGTICNHLELVCFLHLFIFLLCICVDTCQSVLRSGVKSCLQTARVIIYKSFSHIRNRKRDRG